MFFKRVIFFFLFYSSVINSQYTDQINSNRPGASIGAFSVGKNVIQSELGFSYRHFNHNGYNNSTFDGVIGSLAIRWGFVSERLELILDSKYLLAIMLLPACSPPATRIYRLSEFIIGSCAWVGLKSTILNSAFTTSFF